MSQSQRVLVVGASGVIGRVLVTQLIARGHEVLATSRNAPEPARTRQPRWARLDLLDRSQVLDLVSGFRPEIIVNEATALPTRLNPRRLAAYYRANNEVRLQGTRHLLEAAQTSGVRRFVGQSAAYWYAPAGGLVKEEDDPLYLDAPTPIGEAVRTMRTVEREVLASGIPGVNLRYGHFYGPGTWYAPDGAIGTLIRWRAYPIIGGGEGIFSFVHVEDAADATIAAIESDACGTFNVVDDDPAPASAWLPGLAQALGAPAPLNVPQWLARLLIGRSLVDFTVNQRGASNSSALEAFGWRPKIASWREGFERLAGHSSQEGHPGSE